MKIKSSLNHIRKSKSNQLISVDGPTQSLGNRRILITGYKSQSIRYEKKVTISGEKSTSGQLPLTLPVDEYLHPITDAQKELVRQKETPFHKMNTHTHTHTHKKNDNKKGRNCSKRHIRNETRWNHRPVRYNIYQTKTTETRQEIENVAGNVGRLPVGRVGGGG